MSAIPQMDLQRTLRRWDTRRRLAESVLWLPRALLVGVLIGLTVTVAARLQPILLREEVLLIVGGAIGAALILSLVSVWLWPRSSLWLARHFDLRFRLKERISTALELSSGLIPPAQDLSDYQFKDAQRVAANLNVREHIPLKPNYSDVAVLAIGAVILGVLLWMDNPKADELINRRELDAVIAEQQEILEQAKEDILSNEALTEEQQQQLLDPINEALETLQEPEVSREEALAAMTEAEQELREMGEGFSDEQQSAFENAGERLSESEAGEQAGQALAENNLEQAAQELEAMGNQLGEMTPEEQQALAEQLEQAADALQEANPEAADAMRDAAEAIQEGDMQSAQEALEQAADALREQQEQAQNTPESQAANQAAEQIEAGQQEIAPGQQQNQQQQTETQTQQNQEGQQQSGQQQSQNGQQQQPQQGQQQSGEPQSQEGQQGEQQSGQQQNQEGQQQEGQQGQQQSGPPQQGQEGQQQSGQGQQGQEGQPQPGQGQQPGQQGQPQQGQPGGQQGQQPSQSQQSGQSSQSASGTSAGDQPGGEGSDTTQGQQLPPPGNQNNSPGSNDGINPYDQVFSPSRIGENGTETEVELDGEVTSEEGTQTEETDFNEEFEGDSKVQYSDVYADYEDSVQEALESDYIPISLRDVIREYFSSLEP